MAPATSDKIYFIRRNGRITGPFALSRLEEMLQTGSLKETEAFSCDKRHWKTVAELFAEPEPKPEPVPEAIPILQKEFDPLDTIDESYSLKNPLPEKKSVPPPEPPPEFPVTGDDESVSFLSDIGRVIALFWNPSEMFPELYDRPGRAFGIAVMLHFILLTVLALIFGRYISSHANFFFPVAMTWGMFAALTLFTAGVCNCLARKSEPGLWLLPAASLLMDYGMLAGVGVAWGFLLFQGMPAVIVSVIFLVSLCISCNAMQLKAFSELEIGIPPHWIFLITPVLNGVAMAIVYGFIKWM